MLKPPLFKSCFVVLVHWFDMYWLLEPLLQDGIEPMWEDERNKRGGRWLITLNKQQRRLDLDRFWLETVGLAAEPFILSSVVAQISDAISHFSRL